MARAVAVISAKTVARASGVGEALGSEATTGDAAADGAGAGSPQASAMSDAQRARASAKLRRVEIAAPVHKKSGRAGVSVRLARPNPFRLLNYDYRGIIRNAPARGFCGRDARAPRVVAPLLNSPFPTPRNSHIAPSRARRLDKCRTLRRRPPNGESRLCPPSRAVRR